jgi:hypothetical protein
MGLHWNCSGFSAHSSMRRSLFIIFFILTALCASLANGSPKHPAKAHRKVVSATASHPSTTASHRKARQPATGVATRAAGRASRDAARTSKRASEEASVQEPTQRLQASSRKSLRKRTADALPTSTRLVSRSAGQSSRSRRVVKARVGKRLRSGAKLVRVTETSTTKRPIAVETASLSKTRFVMPPPLRGSYESLLRQNQRTEADGLERIQDDEDLADRINRGMLVPVPVSSGLAVNGSLPENRRYCRPWTASFLSDLARAHAAQFRDPILVSSAVRTVAFQKQLMRTNGNATSAEGDIASPHLTGATIDIAKHGMSNQEIGWMRAWLLPLQEAGMIDVEEEFQQSCFHITVYKSFVLANPAAMPVVRASAVPVQAVPVRSKREEQAPANRAEQTRARQRQPAQRKTTTRSRLRHRPEEARREQPRQRRHTAESRTAQGL